MFILYKLCVFKSPIQTKFLFLLLLFCSKNQPHHIWRVTILSIFVSWIQVQVRQAVPPTHILQVTLSLSIWALKSPSRTSKSPAVARFSTPVRDQCTLLDRPKGAGDNLLVQWGKPQRAVVELYIPTRLQPLFNRLVPEPKLWVEVSLTISS